MSSPKSAGKRYKQHLQDVEDERKLLASTRGPYKRYFIDNAHMPRTTFRLKKQQQMTADAAQPAVDVNIDIPAPPVRIFNYR